MTHKIDSDYLKSLSEELDLSRIKTERSKKIENLSENQLSERQQFIQSQYELNGEYYYDRQLQNQDFEKLKKIYKKVSTNFLILNSSIKDIMYKWPERKKSIETILKEERDKLEIGGENSYSEKLYRYLTDGSINQNRQGEFEYTEFELPKRYSHSTDIDRDPMFELKKNTLPTTKKNKL